ncbi:efflux RND transporter periplasmic adaptor subunit [Arsukibacterium sp.]|uniref:efflux RND transporter periplasmic adaptor subunit n=1 Tax=Arsukibacterium sp. TaxID=1977258 RepID=UPI00299D29A7|nr:efflux RND transporter periplasmic adaptor subunit [Arsukibacterium sp.]MDX1678179.1 efflux RND transporter periplasmic adaptor subunit [Arsukibacterium sp.]
MRNWIVAYCPPLKGPLLTFILLLSMVSAQAQAQDKQPVPVRVAMPAAQTVGQQLQLTGTLTARQHARLSARTDGLVSRVRVDAGDKVSEGQVLLELDPALATEQLKQLQAAAQVTAADLTETARLVNEAEQLTLQKLFPQTELELRQANYARAKALHQQAQAAVAQQQEVLARHKLIAPFAGVIAAKLTDAGEWVSLGTPVLELVALSPLHLDVQMPQEHFQTLDQLQQIKVQSDMQPGTELQANIIATVPVIDASARSFLVRLQLQQSSQLQLLPGTSASATFNMTTRSEHSVVVPADAILRHPDGSFSVFIVRDNTAYRRLVTVGRRNGKEVEVEDGLTADEAVVIRGNETLRDGQPVNIVSAQDPGSQQD